MGDLYEIYDWTHYFWPALAQNLAYDNSLQETMATISNITTTSAPGAAASAFSISFLQMALQLMMGLLFGNGGGGGGGIVVDQPVMPMPRMTPPPLPIPTPSPSMMTSSAGTAPAPTTFYALADLPYSPSQAVKLLAQMQSIPDDAEFVIHLGDLRLSDHSTLPCIQSEYDDAAMRLRASPKPVFVLVGDNDWTDCPNRDEGWELWNTTFVGFETKYWPSHPFTIVRQTGRAENFSFVHKGSLLIGLNMVGGPVHDRPEWIERLTQQLDWVKVLVRQYRITTRKSSSLSGGVVGRIIIFGHADPASMHNKYFFNGFTTFVREELNNTIPITYLNGDKHVWSYDENWYDQSSLLRVMLAGNAKELPTKVTINANGIYQDPTQAFSFDRRR
jgi:Calcineurin-like phosphoesterase